jgi:3'-phosphoadenosine 5'-phosphosulfate sulfotransferase (PAPS reductase)/FAD synthetase
MCDNLQKEASMDHVVMMSGGAGSWAAGKRVAEKHGTDNLILLFADTKFEDEDTYRYLRESAANIGGRLQIIADGRDIWQVFVDARFMGNSRIDPCSAKLKREVCDKWIKDRYAPEEVTIYVGIDWTEIHRYERMAERKKPYVYESPLLWNPQISKPQIMEWSKAEGLKQQRLYDMGMPHANCGGGVR